MTLTFGFYNSVANDRTYDAVQMSSIFDGIVVDGVLSTIGGQFMVSPGTSNLSVEIASGRAWFNHTWSLNDGIVVLSIDIADVVNPRIDCAVLEVNSGVATRANTLKIIKGTPSGSPSLPTLTNTETVHQYPLAYITVPAAATEILAGNIQNMVGTGSCPFATGPLTTVTTDVLLAQWEAQFITWFDNLQDELDANQAANLQHQIDDLTVANAVLIETIISTGVDGEFLFDNIPQGYKKLKLVGPLKFNSSGGAYHATTTSMTLNGDTSNIYTGVNPSTGAWNTAEGLAGMGSVPFNRTENDGFFAQACIELPEYANTNMFKWYWCNFWIGVGVGNPTAGEDIRMGLYRSMNAITSILIPGIYLPSVSRLSLYGVPF